MALPPSGMVPPGCPGSYDGLWSSRGYGHLRSSAADREGVVEALKAAFIEGRLDHDELADRVGRAFRSRTYAELAALTGDLPAGQPSRRLLAPRPGYSLRPGQLGNGLPGRPTHGERTERLVPGPAATSAGPVIASLPPSSRQIPPASAPRQLSGFAIASSILGVGGFVTMGITSPFALIAGIAAMPRLAWGSEKGGAFVFLGMMLGLIGTLFILLPELLMGRLLP
jgi:Domain of unknown function (DUF1707)